MTPQVGESARRGACRTTDAFLPYSQKLTTSSSNSVVLYILSYYYHLTPKIFGLGVRNWMRVPRLFQLMAVCSAERMKCSDRFIFSSEGIILIRRNPAYNENQLFEENPFKV